MTRSPSLLRGVFSFSSMTMISRLLGLARDISITHVFGVSAATDAFWVAARTPRYISRLIARHPSSSYSVLCLKEIKETGSRAELRDLTWRVTGTNAVEHAP